MSDYKKLKKSKSLAETLQEAADPKRSNASFGNRDHGVYADLKSKMPVLSDDLVGSRPRFQKLRDKIKSKK